MIWKLIKSRFKLEPDQISSHKNYKQLIQNKNTEIDKTLKHLKCSTLW